MEKRDHVLAIVRYGAAWIEKDAAKRRALLEAGWAEDGAFCDPNDHVVGRDALDALMARFQEERPGSTLEVPSAIEIARDHHRFGWRLRSAQGLVVVEATNFGSIDGTGRLV
ncbi:MAG: hypothetical protein SFX73_04245, partial [Kofleriaceae bacterium]|nr:hypothetical protein [Kofleriaceae bacterium]